MLEDCSLIESTNCFANHNRIDVYIVVVVEEDLVKEDKRKVLRKRVKEEKQRRKGMDHN